MQPSPPAPAPPAPAPPAPAPPAPAPAPAWAAAPPPPAPISWAPAPATSPAPPAPAPPAPAPAAPAPAPAPALDFNVDPRALAFSRVMGLVRGTNPSSEPAFNSQCQAYGACPMSASFAQGQIFVAFLRNTYGEEVSNKLIQDLLILQNAQEKRDHLKSAVIDQMRVAKAKADAMATAQRPPAPASVPTEGSTPTAIATPVQQVTNAVEDLAVKSAVEDALERDRKLREQFETDVDTLQNLIDYKWLDVWAGEDGSKNKEMLQLCGQFLSNTTHAKHEIQLRSWCTTCKEKKGMFSGSSDMKPRVLSLTSKAYYRLTFDEKNLKVTDYMRMPLTSLHSVSQPNSITLVIKSDKEDALHDLGGGGTPRGGAKPKQGIFASALSGSNAQTSEWLYIPTSRVTGKIDRTMIANEMAVILKRAWEITKDEIEKEQ